MNNVRQSEPARVGTVATLLDLLETESGGRASEVHFPETGDRLCQDEIARRAAAVAAALGAPPTPDDVVGLLAPTGPEFLPGLFGIIATGAATTVLPVPPLTRNPWQVATKLLPLVDAADMRRAVVAREYAAVAAALRELRPGFRTVDAAQGVTGRPLASRHLDPARPAIVQFTSGSTSSPKGVVLSHRAVLAGITSIVAAGRIDQDDVLVQWVPLFHDMGLCSLLVALAVRGDAHLFTPATFVLTPLRVLSHMARVRGTIFTGPNFAYDHLLAAVAAKGFDGERLDGWRIAFNGGERVSPSTVEAFDRVLGPLGVRRGTMTPAYGMAEATLEISCKPVDREPTVRCFDRTALNRTPGRAVPVPPRAPGAASLVSAGTPVPGMRVRVSLPDGAPAEEGVIGEIELSGAAVTSGYRDDPLATAALFRDDRQWLRTGDVGFLLDGQLYLTGRIRTMVVLRGRNFFAEDVEAVCQGVEGIRHRSCLAFADPTAERIVVMAETPRAPDEPELVRRIRAAVSAQLDLAELRVVLVRPGTLPRTTSGKWQRDKARAHLAREDRRVGQEELS